jgi:hypothetical protein
MSRSIHHLSYLQNLILKISHRVVYHRDSITLRILFSDDGGFANIKE